LPSLREYYTERRTIARINTDYFRTINYLRLGVKVSLRVTE